MRKRAAVLGVTALVTLTVYACQCPPYCGPVPPPGTCPADKKAQVVYRKTIEYRYNIKDASACGTDSGVGAFGNQGIDITNTYYRAVVGCDSKIHFAGAYASEDVFPRGSDTGLVLDSNRPDKNVRSQALIMVDGTKRLPLEGAYPPSGLTKGTGHFCYARNVSLDWLSSTQGDIVRSGEFVGYLELYVPETYCVPQELATNGVVLAAAANIPAPRGVCSWPPIGSSGSGQLAGFGQPITTLSGCTNDQTSCLCDSQKRCQPKTYLVGATDQLCKGFQWSCFCECPS